MLASISNMVHLLSRIRPAGNRIILAADKFNFDCFKPYEVDFFQSGTAALAAAVIASVKIKSDFSSVPEVLVPAYGCPDLISAIVYASAKPVLIDFEPNLPWMSLNQINNKITENTAAIIAVNFLGIPERMEQLSAICKKHGITLIEDSAQGFPKTKSESYWKGDYAILSFGRGKPVNMLRGGAVLSKNTDMKQFLPKPNMPRDSRSEMFKYLILAKLYNLMITPVLYGLICKLPGLHIGETTYKPLHELTDIPKHILNRLPGNLATYKASPIITEKLKALLANYQNTLLDDLVCATQHDPQKPLLRYPFLVKSNYSKEIIYEKLSPLGASTMYQRPLHKITGVTELIEMDHEVPNATDFANRLITLPTHNGITNSILKEIGKSLSMLSPSSY